MQNRMVRRVLLPIAVAGLASLTVYSNVFVAIDRVRMRLLQAPTAANAGVVRATTAGSPQSNELSPPFALIARLNSPSAETTPFSILVDGVSVCRPEVPGGASRRVDCAVSGPWDRAIVHDVTVRGPTADWTLESLELATHHGNTDGAHYLVILPAASENYLHPAFGWVIATFLMLAAAMLFLPAADPLPRWARYLYRLVAGVVVLELALILCSPWISDYRVVVSAGTFARLLLLAFVPQLLTIGRMVMRSAKEDSVRPVSRRALAAALALVACGVGVALWDPYVEERWNEARMKWNAQRARDQLFAELQPISLANCEFQRFGETNDGGYLLCGNLLAAAQSGYSYGISGYDQWGCDVSVRLAVPVHQYDCFNLTVPVCPGGRTDFHGECIGQGPATTDGRPFDSLENQIERNGDGTKRLVVKMDVEGAEWDSLLQTPDSVLQRVDQLTIELHGVNEARFVAVVKKLKQFFYVANVHFNNFACLEGVAPFPAEVYEVLFVNKQIAELGGSGQPGAPRALMAPNIPQWKDCQSLADLPPVRD